MLLQRALAGVKECEQNYLSIYLKDQKKKKLSREISDKLLQLGTLKEGQYSSLKETKGIEPTTDTHC